jgi:hypothetical protein
MTNSNDLDDFRNIPDRMTWKAAALDQIEKFRQFAEQLGFPWEVAGSHTSKSICLPVIRINCKDMEVYLRDNFHDLNLCVVAKQPIRTPLSVLFEGVLEPFGWDWYLEQVTRCRNYSWSGWTDEQMDMPGLLCLTNDAPAYAVKRPEVKARWCKRLTDPAWYRHDWSSGQITWEGEFGPGVVLWVQNHPFMQGIAELVPSSASQPYKPGCTEFALALPGLDQARNLIQRLCNTPTD